VEARPSKTNFTFPQRDGIHFYKSVDELWNDFAIPVARGVLDHPP
jgi:hypothetical protein